MHTLPEWRIRFNVPLNSSLQRKLNTDFSASKRRGIKLIRTTISTVLSTLHISQCKASRYKFGLNVLKHWGLAKSTHTSTNTAQTPRVIHLHLHQTTYEAVFLFYSQVQITLHIMLILFIAHSKWNEEFSRENVKLAVKIKGLIMY